MISLIEALNYRCLRYVRQELGPFHVLVGANASGKTTFLDVVGFLHDLVTEGLDEAIRSRSANFYDLVWRKAGQGFELAVEAPIPETLRDSLENDAYKAVRYEVAVRLEKRTNRLEIAAEQALLTAGSDSQPTGQDAPPDSLIEPGVVMSDGSLSPHCLFAKSDGPEAPYFLRFQPEAAQAALKSKWSLQVSKGSLLAALPEVDFVHPVSRWLRDRLSEGIEALQLDPLCLRRPSPPGQGSEIGPDGSHLPWVIAQLERESPERLNEWIKHLRMALPDLVGLTTIERPEDRHRYLWVEYPNGLKLPSWMVSDGTLRLLALTLPAYLTDFDGMLLVEEPENGVHPLAIEPIYQSLSSVYDGQVLLATHCPLLVAVAKPSEVLCFSKDSEGATRIVSGDLHRELRDWRGEVNLGTLFAAGVLG